MKDTDLTDRLAGFTFLYYLEFSTEPDSGVCKLILHLTESEKFGASGLRAEFNNVRNLNINQIGGGLTQFQSVLIEDISDRQLDRVTYQVREMERDAISFMCQGVVLADLE